MTEKGGSFSKLRWALIIIFLILLFLWGPTLKYQASTPWIPWFAPWSGVILALVNIGNNPE